MYFWPKEKKVVEYDKVYNEILNNLIVKAFMMDFWFFSILSSLTELIHQKGKIV